MEFPYYILKNHIDSDTDFRPELWAENVHMHFNSKFYTSHPHIHQIIQILMEIQVNTDLKIKKEKTCA